MKTEPCKHVIPVANYFNEEPFDAKSVARSYRCPRCMNVTKLLMTPRARRPFVCPHQRPVVECIKEIVHYDYRQLEFKRELLYDGVRVETRYPTRCGRACAAFTLPHYLVGVGYELSRITEPKFDFERWCYDRRGDAHRDKDLNIREGEL